MNKRNIELLSPARDIECGIAAIDHGADAVYIGASKFGARSEAGNSINDIEQLCKYAHLYGARIYLAINTILFDNEIDKAVKLAWDCYHAGVDALIIQDMGLLECDLPPIPIHASTQTNNRTAEKVAFLEKIGFSQIVLARELNIDQIKNIRNETSVTLEFFIHGALCTCFSGQCYMSSYATGRSGNRGECSQMCRHKYTLSDAEGKMISKDRFLLSLKDLNLSANIEDLIDAGIDSFKIEGRLKGPEYVKNITAYYRNKIDVILAKRADLERTSIGESTIKFNPDPSKTFNRQFTDYFLNSQTQKIANIQSPKSTGEYLGKISESGTECMVIDGSPEITNGDGLCYYDINDELVGFRVNKTEGNKIYPNPRMIITAGTSVYRNSDIHFNQILNNSKYCRKIEVDITLSETEKGICLKISDERGISAEAERFIEKQVANDAEKQYQLLKQQMSKLGDTIFKSRNIELCLNNSLFIPSKLINELRREASMLLQIKLIEGYKRFEKKTVPNQVPYIKSEVGYDENIANSKAERFYKRHGVKTIEKAFELIPKKPGQILMTTKYCVRKELNLCLLELPASQKPKISQYYIEDNTGKYRIEFDCKECQMKIFST